MLQDEAGALDLARLLGWLGHSWVGRGVLLLRLELLEGAEDRNLSALAVRAGGLAVALQQVQRLAGLPENKRER